MPSTRRKTTTSVTFDLDPEGAHPVKQERSRQLRDRALTVTRKLIEEGSFANTTMADIARTVGCSSGALYFRFHDKDAMFASAVEVAMVQEVENLRAVEVTGRYINLPLRETVMLCVRDYVSFAHKNEAMIHALYQRTGEDPGSWGIVRRGALSMTNIWINAIACAANSESDRSFLRQTGIAFQFVSSTLVYSALIDRPVRPMSAQELEFWLSEMVMHFIGLDRSSIPRPQRAASASRKTASNKNTTKKGPEK